MNFPLSLLHSVTPRLSLSLSSFFISVISLFTLYSPSPPLTCSYPFSSLSPFSLCNLPHRFPLHHSVPISVSLFCYFPCLSLSSPPFTSSHLFSVLFLPFLCNLLVASSSPFHTPSSLFSYFSIFIFLPCLFYNFHLLSRSFSVLFLSFLCNLSRPSSLYLPVPSPTPLTLALLPSPSPLTSRRHCYTLSFIRLFSPPPSQAHGTAAHRLSSLRPAKHEGKNELCQMGFHAKRYTHRFSLSIYVFLVFLCVCISSR